MEDPTRSIIPMMMITTCQIYMNSASHHPRATRTCMWSLGTWCPTAGPARRVVGGTISEEEELSDFDRQAMSSHKSLPSFFSRNGVQRNYHPPTEHAVHQTTWSIITTKARHVIRGQSGARAPRPIKPARCCAFAVVHLSCSSPTMAIGQYLRKVFNFLAPPPDVSQDGRDQWPSRAAFLLAAMGGCAGQGNLLRYPSVLYNNYGLQWFIPYLIAVFFIAIPTLILEISIGQAYRGGTVIAFNNIHRRLKGVGMGPVIVSFIVTQYFVT